MKIKTILTAGLLGLSSHTLTAGETTILQHGQTDIRQQTTHSLQDAYAAPRFESKGLSSKGPSLECKGIEGIYCDYAPDIGALVLFEFNQARIKPAYRSMLNDVVASLRNDLPNAVILVAGHTDSMGSDVYNQGLSERRAEAIRGYLIQQGVPPARLQSRGFGENHAICDNASASGQAWNRRVEFMRIETLDRWGRVLRRFKAQPGTAKQGGCDHAPG